MAGLDTCTRLLLAVALLVAWPATVDAEEDTPLGQAKALRGEWDALRQGRDEAVTRAEACAAAAAEAMQRLGQVGKEPRGPVDPSRGSGASLVQLEASAALAEGEIKGLDGDRRLLEDLAGRARQGADRTEERLGEMATVPPSRVQEWASEAARLLDEIAEELKPLQQSLQGRRKRLAELTAEHKRIEGIVAAAGTPDGAGPAVPALKQAESNLQEGDRAWQAAEESDRKRMEIPARIQALLQPVQSSPEVEALRLWARTAKMVPTTRPDDWKALLERFAAARTGPAAQGDAQKTAPSGARTLDRARAAAADTERALASAEDAERKAVAELDRLRRAVAKLSGRPREGLVTVPDVSGLAAGDAVRRIAGSRLKPIPVAAKGRAREGMEGRCESTDPPPGTELARGSDVRVYLFPDRNATLAQVPDVSGLPAKAALARVTDAGLKSTPVAARRLAPPGREGTCETTDPPPGTDVAVGSAVRVFLYPGKVEDLVEVPRVRSLTAEKAEAELRRVGLQIKLVDSSSSAPSAADAGTVATQSPGPGTRVKRGDVVIVALYPDDEADRLDDDPEVTEEDTPDEETSGEETSGEETSHEDTKPSPGGVDQFLGRWDGKITVVDRHLREAESADSILGAMFDDIYVVGATFPLSVELRGVPGGGYEMRSGNTPPSAGRVDGDSMVFEKSEEQVTETMRWSLSGESLVGEGSIRAGEEYVKFRAEARRK